MFITSFCTPDVTVCSHARAQRMLHISYMITNPRSPEALREPLGFYVIVDAKPSRSSWMRVWLVGGRGTWCVGSSKSNQLVRPSPSVLFANDRMPPALTALRIVVPDCHSHRVMWAHSRARVKNRNKASHPHHRSRQLSGNIIAVFPKEQLNVGDDSLCPPPKFSKFWPPKEIAHF